MMMRAVRYHEYGSPEVLRVEDIPAPVPGEGQVLVRVAATSYNPIDGALRAGVFKTVMPLPLPYVPGLDIAGEVIAVGAGVDHWRTGDPVLGYLPRTMDGACAEYAAVPADILAAPPAMASLVDAAALPLVGLTAWQALFEHAGLQPGQRVLVYGAGGTVGRMAVQIAKATDAYVVAATNASQADIARADGADLVLDYTAGDWLDRVGASVEVVFNLAPAGVVDLAAIAPLIGDGGALITAAAPLPDELPTHIRGLRMASHPDAQQLADLVAMVDAGKLRSLVTDVRGLDEARDIHQKALDGALHGKTVIRPDLP